MNAIILSAQFWPSFREEKITLPAQLQSSLDAYTQQYEMLKGNRTLVWKPHLGGLDCVCEDRCVWCVWCIGDCCQSVLGMVPLWRVLQHGSDQKSDLLGLISICSKTEEKAKKKQKKAVN